MVTFITVIYVIDCLFLILVVLLQAGKGGGLGALSGGSTQTVFGGAGAANFMTRLTMVVAALFMILSGTLAYMSSTGQRSLDAAAERAKALEEARNLSAVDLALAEAEAAGQSLAAAVDAGASMVAVDAGTASVLDVVDDAIEALAQADDLEAEEPAEEKEAEPAAEAPTADVKSAVPIEAQ